MLRSSKEPSPGDSGADNEPLLPHGQPSARAVRARNRFLGYRTRPPKFFQRLFALFRNCLINWLFPRWLLGHERDVHLCGYTDPQCFPGNAVQFQKYTALSIIPSVIGHQFHHLFSAFYIIISFSQFIPQLQVGPLFTYIAPLAFVLTVTLLKEAHDDLQRRRRQKDINGTPVRRLDRATEVFRAVPASSLRVGDIIRLESGERIPCDCVFLRAENSRGTTFVRTDQLDGETDWKLKRAVTVTQAVTVSSDLAHLDGWVSAEKPKKDIYNFIGNFYYAASESPSQSVIVPIGSIDGAGNLLGREVTPEVEISKFAVTSNGHSLSRDIAVEALGLENILWGNTVVTDGPIWCLVLYTGSECRSALNSSVPRYKVGIFDLEANRIAKMLLVIMVLGSLFLTAARANYRYAAVVHFLRFLLLLSTIIPISLTVNLDMAKTFYAWRISKDTAIEGTVVRNSNIPEELGRVDVLFTDKTGTLTQNCMTWKKLHLGRMQFGHESLQEISHHIAAAFSETSAGAQVRRRFEIRDQLRKCVVALALCHNVTPVVAKDGSCSLQAASPDEIALTTFAAEVGVRLVERDDHRIVLRVPHGAHLLFSIKECFPFSSHTKRMGIIVQLVDAVPAGCPPASLLENGFCLNDSGRYSNISPAVAAEIGQITFYLKGAETVVYEKVERRSAHWLLEESDSFGAVGLRTLVIASKNLTADQLQTFQRDYAAARADMTHRASRMRHVIEALESGMNLLGLTGVEDRLQPNIAMTLEALRHGGVRVWMLTGDKVQTATCVAIAAGLKTRQQEVRYLTGQMYSTGEQVKEVLDNLRMGVTELALVLDGPFIDRALVYCPITFVEATILASSVVCCRCSPEQKARIITLVQQVTKQRCCAVGDGGNDVPMIQAADCGIGIVGKEGKQASLAADFSINEFSHIYRLFFWHGRNAYQASSRLTQFVLHRGLVIATCQMIFCSAFFFISMAIFQGWLTVGYATYYTTLPVIATVVDRELPEAIVFMFPELYDSLRQGRAMSSKVFFQWLWISLYQGSVIMLGALLLFERDLSNIVAVAFTSLILAELLNAASGVHVWHWTAVAAEILSLIMYLGSMLLLPNFFNLQFISTTTFWINVTLITMVSWLPSHLAKVFMKNCLPTRDTKLAH